jgi:MSHA biogenesis protein MshL
VENGRIVAIGGLMKQSFDEGANRVPGIGRIPGLGALFGNTRQNSRKSELVILIRPTVIDSQADWQADAEAVRTRIEKLERKPIAP